MQPGYKERRVDDLNDLNESRSHLHVNIHITTEGQPCMFPFLGICFLIIPFGVPKTRTRVKIESGVQFSVFSYVLLIYA